MIFKGNYHTHTKASDGSSTVRENADCAIAAGLEEIAITDHAFKSILCHLTREKFDAQEKEIEGINKEGKIKVLHGAEASLISLDGKIDVPDDVIRRADVLHLGFHRFLQANVWKGAFLYIVVNGFLPYRVRMKLKEKNTAAYEKAIRTYPIDVLVHLGHRATVDTARIVKLAAENDIYVELNEKHIETLENDIDIVLASGVKLIVGTDAHRKKDVANFSKIEEFILKHNVPQDRIYGLSKLPTFKDKSGWKGVNGL